MSKKTVYIFVEGKDDHALLKLLIDQGIFEKKYPKDQYSFKIIKYRANNGKKESNVGKEVKTLQTQNIPVLFFGDLDFIEKKMCVEHRAKAIKEQYELTIPSSDIIIVAYEIESWLLAGFSEKFCNYHNIEFIEDTQFVRKEIFEKLRLNRGITLWRFLLKDEQKDKYSIKEARQRNQSFRKFFEKYCQTAI